MEDNKPVVDLCIGKNPPVTAEEAKRFTVLQRLLRNKFGAFLFFLIAMTICSAPVIPLAPLCIFLQGIGVFSHLAIKRFFDLCTGNWINIMMWYFEFALGVNVRMFGYDGKFKKRSVIIMNHVSHLDWMFLWSVVDRQGDLSIWKAITKNLLKQLPIIGWCMQLSGFIFISRSWQQDQSEFRTKLYYTNGLGNYPCQLLLFPEGGDFTYKSKKKSDTFADQKGLPRYKYCLQPHSTGFVYVLNALRSGYLDAVYDMTIAYPDSLAKTEVDLLKGVIPREVHFHVHCYDNKELPEDDEGLTQWCRDRWNEKEERLKNYYTHHKFKESLTNVPNGGSGAAVSNGDALHDSPEVVKPHNYRFLLYSIFIVVFANSLVFAAILKSWIAWVFFWLCVPFLFYVSIYGGGLDYFFINFQKKQIEAALKKSKKHNTM